MHHISVLPLGECLQQEGPGCDIQPAAWQCAAVWARLTAGATETQLSSFSIFLVIVSTPKPPPRLSPHTKNKQNKTYLPLPLYLPLSFPLSLSLSLWSPHRNSVPSILQLSGSLQPCMPLAYLSTKLHNDERVNKGEETDSGEGERWEKERGQGKERRNRQGDGAVLSGFSVGTFGHAESIHAGLICISVTSLKYELCHVAPWTIPANYFKVLPTDSKQVSCLQIGLVIIQGLNPRVLFVC